MAKSVWVVLIAVLLFGSQRVVADHEPYWTQGPSGMSGLGSIYKVAARASSDLHWRGGPVPLPESTSFDITIAPSGREDCDTYHWWDPDSGQWKSNDQLNRSPDVYEGYSWLRIWKSSVGNMNGNTFTPPTYTDSSVTIECFIYDSGTYIHDYDASVTEGYSSSGEPILAYSDGGSGEHLHRTWGGHLKVYKVGVYMQPANYTIWEDYALPDKFFTLASDLSGLESYISSTYYYNNSAGQTDDASGWAFNNINWTTKTDPSGCNIMGGISFRPEIKASGRLNVSYVGDSNGGSTVSTITATVLGTAGSFSGSPAWVAASASVVSTLGSGGSDASVGIALSAVIQYLDDSKYSTKVEHYSGTTTGWWWLTGWYINSLDAYGYANYKEGTTINGSIQGTTHIGIMDTSYVQWSGMKVEEDTGYTSYLKYGSWRPSYSYTGP